MSKAAVRMDEWRKKTGRERGSYSSLKSVMGAIEVVEIRFYEDSYWSVILVNLHLWKSTSSSFNTRLSSTLTVQARRGPHIVLQRALIARI